MEYSGEGVATLSVPERATITNMGAELGATTSVFPSDDQTRAFLKSQGREAQWSEKTADPDAQYDEVVEIDLSALEPMIAQPHMPDNVVKVKELKGTKVHQVGMGSCTNSSYRDLMIVAGMLKDRKVHADVTAGLAPGSRQVVLSLIKNGQWENIISSGVRILENVCGPCIGMGFSPPTEAVTLRTFNRNFLGRSGTKSASVYLCSPETAVAAALTGKITDPRDLGIAPVTVQMPEQFPIDDSMIIPPKDDASGVEIIRGPNIQPLPLKDPLSDTLTGPVLLKTEDNITTDHIMPAGAKILPKRSNIPAISEHVFEVVDPTFPQRSKKAGGGFIVGGANYGQGSSREHAALAPMYLGIKAVITQSFARIHLANLINFGIIPFTFVNESDYGKVDQDDDLEIDVTQIENTPIIMKNKTKGIDIPLTHPLSARDIDLIKAGGSLAYAKQQLNK
jgi:aconitate hydratase